MSASAYDVVTVGGGLGGAAMAKVMAEAGYRVLVLERVKEFRDRVRGEVLVPWGCVEAKRLGIYDLLREIGGHDLRYWALDVYGAEILRRDLVSTSPIGLPIMTYFHPNMQDAILTAAIEVGAEVRRGARAEAVTPGRPARVRFAHEGSTEEVEARIVVGADGRGSQVRSWGGFEASTDRLRRFFAGILMDDLPAPEDTLHSRMRPAEGLMSWLFPQGGGRVRAYIGYHADSGYARLQGEADVPRFIETSIGTGVPEEYFAGAKVSGPLATFDATDNWVDHPYRDGIALVGDAAATSDPTWGQGMSLTMADVRILSDFLKSSDDWDRAGHAYAAAHDRVYGACHACDNWFTDVFLDIGPEAEALRAKAFPAIMSDFTRLPDVPITGPDAPHDEVARRRFFGEE